VTSTSSVLDLVTRHICNVELSRIQNIALLVRSSAALSIAVQSLCRCLRGGQTLFVLKRTADPSDPRTRCWLPSTAIVSAKERFQVRGFSALSSRKLCNSHHRSSYCVNIIYARPESGDLLDPRKIIEHQISCAHGCLCVPKYLDICSKRSLIHISSSALEIAVQCVIPRSLDNAYLNLPLVHRSVSDISVHIELVRADVCLPLTHYH